MGLESGIRKKPMPDPGYRGQKGTGSWIRIRNTEKKVPSRTSNFFSHFSFVAVLDLRSWIRDPGSEILDPRSWIRDPGSEILDPRSEIRNPGWIKISIRDPG
jgi:hypothetical protein